MNKNWAVLKEVSNCTPKGKGSIYMTCFKENMAKSIKM